MLAGGRSLDYDRLVIAPGIDILYESIEGYDEAAAEVMPHAWQGGPQTRLLSRQVEAMEPGGLLIIAAPSEPYRCRPGRTNGRARSRISSPSAIRAPRS